MTNLKKQKPEKPFTLERQAKRKLTVKEEKKIFRTTQTMMIKFR